VPVEFIRVRDADTVEVRLPASPFTWAVRLLDVWAPELHRGDDQALARRGARWLGDYLAACDDLRLYVPLPVGDNLLKSLSFDRVVGVIYVGPHGQTMNELVIRSGFASSTKGGPLGR
jgi:endonuclease YncB( thermonuclease family)